MASQNFNDMQVEYTSGQYDLLPSHRQYDEIGFFPSRFVELTFSPRPTHPEFKTGLWCARCGHTFKAKYTYWEKFHPQNCYRCAQYLKVKRRTAREDERFVKSVFGPVKGGR